MKSLHLAILKSVSAMPDGYLAPHDALRNDMRWAVIPQPSFGEIDAALDKLEEQRLLTCVTHALYGKRWGITDAGKAALRS